MRKEHVVDLVFRLVDGLSCQQQFLFLQRLRGTAGVSDAADSVLLQEFRRCQLAYRTFLGDCHEQEPLLPCQ